MPVRSPFHWVLVLDSGGILVGLVILDSRRTDRRHGTAWARKRYAGLLEEDGRKEAIFVGMESVRSEWTDLSKEFQKGLYERAFPGEPVEDFGREFVGRLRAGKCDSLLVYRKWLRELLDQHTETPPRT